MSTLDRTLVTQLNFEKLNGLLPVVIQDFTSKEILMLAFMNKKALDKTLETRQTHFWSRSRQKLWRKGETSGHIQRVKEIWVDCDTDSLVIVVEQVGQIACHTGERSCFHKQLL